MENSGDVELASFFFNSGQFPGSELVIGLVGPVGTNLARVVEDLEERLNYYEYETREIRVSQIIENSFHVEPYDEKNEYERISKLMNAGDLARERGPMVLALGVAAFINAQREKNEDKKSTWTPKQAFVINSLKHPEEVKFLKHIYGDGFILIGVYSDAGLRQKHLQGKAPGMTSSEAQDLMDRDEKEEGKPSGQRTRDTFHLADYFMLVDEHEGRRRAGLKRILDLLFGHPNLTPTFEEFAMFMAFSSALRSADLSRQVGAVVANNEEILATGANDCPRFPGGLYWPIIDEKDGTTYDADQGRDFKRGIDSNDKEKLRIVEEISERVAEEIGSDKLDKIRNALLKSSLDDITEYGRTVHAEMEALLLCARNNISCRGATLYTTTFPCHNCAKHIIAAGISRVVYVEPYPKSKAIEFHDDAAYLGFSKDNSGAQRTAFEPFLGVGPRRFFDLFSMHMGSGYQIQRKDKKIRKCLAVGRQRCHTTDWDVAMVVFGTRRTRRLSV